MPIGSVWAGPYCVQIWHMKRNCSDDLATFCTGLNLVAVKLDECENVNCGEGGVCSHTVGEAVTNRYTCSCADGYSDGGDSTACSVVYCPANSVGTNVGTGDCAC